MLSDVMRVEGKGGQGRENWSLISGTKFPLPSELHSGFKLRKDNQHLRVAAGAY